MKRASEGGMRSGEHKRLRNVEDYDYDHLPEVADFEDNLTQTQHRNAPSTSAAFERSIVETMTADQINKHIHTCLEMSSENRITPKNAFALQLIDCLQYLVDEKKDFSTMACSLDAGAKIYSNRVDGLHQQVMTLADEVTLNARKMNIGGRQSDGLLKGRLGRKTRGIIASKESIRRKIKLNDPKDKYLKVNALPGEIISNVRLDRNDLSFTLENDLPFWPKYENYKPTRAEGYVRLPRLEVLRDAKHLVRFDIGTNNSPTHNVSSGEESSAEHPENHPEDIPKPEMNDEPTEDIPSPEMNDEPIADIPSPEMNDKIEDIPASDDDPVEDELDDTNEQEEGRASNEKEIDVLSTAMARLNQEAQQGLCPPPTRVEALKMLFDHKSEYHYLDMKNAKYWAGPDYWTRHHPGPSAADNKKTRGRKKKQPGMIEYDVDDEVLEVEWNKGLCSRSTFSIKKELDWQSASTTLPKDLQLDADMFFDLFHIKLKDIREANEANKTNERARSELQDLSVEFVDIENKQSSTTRDEDKNPFSSLQENEESPISPDDVDYSCNIPSPKDESPSSPNDVDYSCDIRSPIPEIGGGRLIKIYVDSDNTPGYDDSSMVPAPKTVSVTPLNFKSRPIRVNMRNLKEVMLDMIMVDFKKSPRQTTFSKLFREIRPRLEKTTANDLTPSIAFLALLTLANENNLNIQSCDGNKDAIVTMMGDLNENNIEANGDMDSETVDLLNMLSE